MRIRPLHAFLGGIAVTALIAAARFTGGTPVDQTFTYQGQLRNAGQLVNGTVDLRVTLWDSDVGGAQIGGTNTFNALQLADGRFACGLNFGNSAFDGSNRWIQVEFRSPAGSGQYLTLSPRDKVTATPYALYALNGANGVWVYNTNQQSVTVMGKKVGIGTSNPTAALEVVSAAGGDDSVKLPPGSIEAAELGAAPSRSLGLQGQATATGTGLVRPIFRTIAVPADGVLSLFGGWNGCAPGGQLWVDGQVVGGGTSNSAAASVPVSAGEHVIEYRTEAPFGSCSTIATLLVVFTPYSL